MRLHPDEPLVTAWRAEPVEAVVQRLLDASPGLAGRPAVVAIDGGGGAGKSTLAVAITSVVPATAVVHTDDLAWNEPFFEWGGLLRQVLLAARTGEAVAFVPPAWAPRGRAGAVVVPAGCRLLVVEGTGSAQRSVADLLDAVIWMQSDGELAERRALVRDVEEGANGDAAAAKAFWDEWMVAEVPFFAADRPWERATEIVAGTPVIDLAEGQVAVAATGRSTPRAPS